MFFSSVIAKFAQLVTNLQIFQTHSVQLTL